VRATIYAVNLIELASTAADAANEALCVVVLPVPVGGRVLDVEIVDLSLAIGAAPRIAHAAERAVESIVMHNNVVPAQTAVARKTAVAI
jgi:hypothetical protein